MWRSWATEETKYVLRPVKQWEQLGNMHNLISKTFLNKNPPTAKLDIYWLCAICKAKCVITHMLVVKLQFHLSLREMGDNVLLILLLFPICVACNATSLLGGGNNIPLVLLLFPICVACTGCKADRWPQVYFWCFMFEKVCFYFQIKYCFFEENVS